MITDPAGTATLPTCGSILDVTRDGYGGARLLPPFANPVLVQLAPERRASESVTVVGPAAGQPEAGVPAQIAITLEELAMLRSVTFDDPVRTLQQLPGVGTSDELRAELSVRGSPFRQVGLVLDEVKSRLLVHTVRGVEQTGSVALLNADLLDAATLTPGAGPQRFGNTVGAELGIRTRAGRQDGFHGRAMASAIAATGFVEGPIGSDRVTFIAGVRRSYASWIVRRIDPDVSGTFEFTDGQAKLDARLGTRQSLSAGLLAGSSAYDERGRRTTPNALDLGKNETAMGTLAWQAQVGSQWIVRQRIAAISSRYRNENPEALPLDSGTEHEWLSRSIVEWAPAPSVSLDAAGQVQSFTSRGASVVYQPNTGLPLSDVSHHGTQTLAGGHVHARWSPHRGVTLASGVRGDRVLDLETFVGGWAQAQVALSTDVALTAAVSRHGQSPDVLQRFGPAGTADLAFETATLVDAGLAWRRGPWGLALNLYDRREADGLDTPERQFRLTPKVPSPVATPERRGRTRGRVVRAAPNSSCGGSRAPGRRVSAGRDGSAMATAPRHTRARSIRSSPAHSISVISSRSRRPHSWASAGTRPPPHASRRTGRTKAGSRIAARAGSSSRPNAMPCACPTTGGSISASATACRCRMAGCSCLPRRSTPPTGPITARSAPPSTSARLPSAGSPRSNSRSSPPSVSRTSFETAYGLQPAAYGLRATGYGLRHRRAAALRRSAFSVLRSSRRSC